MLLTEAEDEFQRLEGIHSNSEAVAVATVAGVAVVDNHKHDTQNEKDKNKEMEDHDNEECDFMMYAGMFRTSMEMLEDAGAFQVPIQDISKNDLQQ